jgi:hypothetical protein
VTVRVDGLLAVKEAGETADETVNLNLRLRGLERATVEDVLAKLLNGHRVLKSRVSTSMDV